MTNRKEYTYGSIIVIQRQDYKWGIINKEGIEIVPFGKYNWIDGFDQGLARVRKGVYADSKWGIINEKGEEVLPVEYDNIWNFLGKNRYSIKIIKNGITKEICLHDLNPELPIKCVDKESEYYTDYYSENRHYEQYAGSYAQDVMGYSDEEIDDAFEGDPSLYWNID
ncbi:MAG: WG repeat-containing protein [Bacteroidales bacterium]|jgi:hypothetical protein|nr:WG repeat-containing protein [Bacteroidales bacterium]